ncbi:MAG TPA: hypothetical protein VLE03_08530, partial [Nitrospiraceae bacterium]|nr:hypothetical protein [Nitrospiraceae bacterium]
MKQCLRSRGQVLIYANLAAQYAWLIWLFLFSSPHLSFAQESPSSSQKNERTSSQEQRKDSAEKASDP